MSCLGLVRMSMSHLFRLDIPFLLQLALSLGAEIIASIHELPTATLPGDKKKNANIKYRTGKGQDSRREGAANITESLKLISTCSAQEGSDKH